MELKRCWRCGGRGIYVDKSGWASDEETEFVSCHWRSCMPHAEKYTVEQWQKRAVEDELEKTIADLQAENTFLKNNKAETYTMPCDPQWIPVSVPPTEGKKYWVVSESSVYKAVYNYGKFCWTEDNSTPYTHVTHYMERQGKPKPPKKG